MFILGLSTQPLDYCPICEHRIAPHADVIAIFRGKQWVNYAHAHCAKVLREAVNQLVEIER